MRYWLFNLLFLFSFQAFAQDSTKVDSTHNQQLNEATFLLKQKEQQRLLDSVRQQELFKQIEQLKTSDARSRTELERKYQQMVREDSIKNRQRSLRLEELRKTAKGFPVQPFQDTLFFIYTRVGSFNVQERANSITNRIQQLYEKTPLGSADTLQLVDGDTETDIMHGDVILMAVTDTDALWFGKDRRLLAQEYAGTITAALQKERKENSLKNILVRVGLTLLVLVGLSLIIFLINRLFTALKFFVYSKRNSYFKSYQIKEFQLLNRQRQIQFVIFALSVFKIILILLALYLALPLLLSIFPQTKGWSDTLLHWIISPVIRIVQVVVGYLPNLFTVVVIFLFTRYTVKLLRVIAREIEHGNLTISGFYKDWALPTFNIVRFLLYIFMFIVIFPYLPGSDSPIFQGVSVFLGLLLSLGSSSAVSNIVAGLVITYMRPFKIGDRVKIGEITGDVIEKTMLVTRLRTTKNEDITVPNSSVLSGHTINYTTSSQELGLILHVTVTIGYDVPWKQVHQLLIDAALATSGILKEKAPFVLQTGLEDFYISYQLNAYTNQPERGPAIYSGIYQNIQDAFNKAGVEILSPHYRAVRDGNQTAMPSEYLPQDYEPTSFRVEQTGNKSEKP